MKFTSIFFMVSASIFDLSKICMKNKRGKALNFASFILSVLMDYFFVVPLYSSDTVNFLRPLARRLANTRRPFAVAILSRKPCLFFLFLLEGWNVLFFAYI